MTPTSAAFESAVGALDGGECVAFASGMAAVSAVLRLAACRGAAIVLVQPDAVAAVDLKLRGGLVGEDPVDEEGLRGARVRVALEDPRQPALLRDPLVLERDEVPAPVVARDRERHLVAAGASRRAAARERHERRDGQGGHERAG